VDFHHDLWVHRYHDLTLPFTLSDLVLGLLLLGHAYMVLLVILCQTLVYREVTALFSLRSHKPDTDDFESKGKDPWRKTLNWYFFAVANYFLYGESIIYYFKVSYSSLRMCSSNAVAFSSMWYSQMLSCSRSPPITVSSASRCTRSALSALSCR
jgi:hypothetical protein